MAELPLIAQLETLEPTERAEMLGDAVMHAYFSRAGEFLRYRHPDRLSHIIEAEGSAEAFIEAIRASLAGTRRSDTAYAPDETRRELRELLRSGSGNPGSIASIVRGIAEQNMFANREENWEASTISDIGHEFETALYASGAGAWNEEFRTLTDAFASMRARIPYG